MSAKDFFQYRTNCIVCDQILTNICRIDILLDSPDNNAYFAFPGSIFYIYSTESNSFHKHRKSNNGYGDSSQSKSIVDTLYDTFPDTFILNKRIRPRLQKRKMSELITPMRINSFDFRLEAECQTKNSNHIYYYESNMIYDGGELTGIPLEVGERMVIHGFNIYNADNETRIGSVIGIKLLTLPLIQITKWNTSNKIALQEQLSKYLILK